MKKTKLIWCALTAIVVAFYLVGCQLNEYSIKAPANLQHRIDSIAAAKAGMSKGDTTYIDMTTKIVGAADNSAAWLTAFSDYFTIPANKLLHLEFVNHSSGANNWNNWNLAVTNQVADRSSVDYKEYFVLRSDAYGWGNGDFNINLISQNYPDTDGNSDIWNDFRKTMEGAYVSIDIDHSATGTVFVKATAVGTNGITLVETYNQPVSATDNIVAFLIADHSHFDMKKAYLLPSKAKDANPASMAITGAPASVELGNKNFWDKAIATVTFADGSSKKVDSLDLSFTVIPDMTTPGTKTVIVSYSKTKQGSAFAKAVSTFYTLQVTNSIVSIAASNINYYYFSSADIIFNPNVTNGIVVTATYADASTSILGNNVIGFQYPNPSTFPPTAGSQTVGITYVGATKTFTTTSTVTLVKGLSQVGANDFSTVFWTAFSNDYTVASGSSKTFTMYCYANPDVTKVANYHSPCTILRKASALPTSTEYGVVRMDNFGWGSGYGAATLTSDWDWLNNKFASSISGSKIVIKVTNNGNNTADILYTVTYASGETHFQKYAGITVDSSDLSCALVLEKAYIVLVN